VKKERQVGEVAAKVWEEAAEHMRVIEKKSGMTAGGQRFISACVSFAFLARARVAPPGSMGRTRPKEESS